jgi:hypothetical protein
MTYSKEELAKKFGDVFNEQGGFDKDGASDSDVKRLMDNKELRNHFTGEMGRSTDDWDDGHKSVNDLSTVFDALRDDDVAPVAEDPEPYQMSEELATAKAGVKSFEEHVLPNQGDIIMGKDKDPATGKSFNMQRYKDAFQLNLGEYLKPVEADGSPRESKLKQEEEAVEGY